MPHVDVEMHAKAADPVEPRRTQLLENALGANGESDRVWPGLRAYLNHLDDQMVSANASCFIPLWSVLRLEIPATKEDLLDLVNKIAVIFQEHGNDALSIDDVLQRLLTPFHGDLDRVDPNARNLSRQAVFKVLLGWP